MLIKDFSLSIVVPVYNQTHIIRDSVEKIHQYVRGIFSIFEIIMVDDGSIDNTYNALLDLSGKINSLKLLKNDTNCGKGYSVKKGVLSASSDYVVFTDADLSTPIDELDKFLSYLKKGVDIVIGSRACKDSQILKRQALLRRNMGKIFNLLVQLFLFKGIRDTQCGFKCFKKEVAQNLFERQTINGFAFDVEILYIAKCFGYSIQEVPVKWINADKTRVHLVKDSFKMFFDLFMVKRNQKSIIA